MTILHGIEVDIMPDGQLDFPDDVLETLDIVLASLHEPPARARAALTRRCIDAIRHPLVSIITHPAIGSSDGGPHYPLDFNAIYEAAAETGTALEIDGAPAPPRPGRRARPRGRWGWRHGDDRQRLSPGAARSPAT